MNSRKLIAIGEALIDFIPSAKGVAFDDVGSFFPAVGGAPANVCGAFSRLGGNSVFLTQLGDDPFGHKIERYLGKTGIDTSYISFTDKANTALAFVSLDKDGDRTFSFYRNPSADMLYDESQVPSDAFEDAFALHFCSVSLGDFPMKNAHVKAIEYAKAKGSLISFDPNLRFPLWKNAAALKAAVEEFLPYADILKISDEELEFITGTDEIEKALPVLFNGNVNLILYTCGKKGAFAYTRNAKGHCGVLPGDVVDTTGAGDASIGSFLWKLNEYGVTRENINDLTSERLDEALLFMSKYCTISVGAKGAIPSYPTLKELEERYKK